MALAEEIGHPTGEAPQNESRDLEPLAVALEVVDPHPEIAQPFAIGPTEPVEDPPMAVVCDADVEITPKLLAEAELVGMVDHGLGLVVDGPAFSEQRRTGTEVFADELASAESTDLLEGGSPVGGEGVGDERGPQTEFCPVAIGLGDGLIGVVEDPFDLRHRPGPFIGDLPAIGGADSVIGNQ